MTPEELDRAVSDALGVKLDPGFDFVAHEWGPSEMCFRPIDAGWGETSACCGDKQECLRCWATICTALHNHEDEPIPARCVRAPEKPKTYSSTVALALSAVKSFAQTHGFLCWDLQGAPKDGYAMNISCPGVTFRGEAESAAEAICRAIVAAVRRGA